MAVFRVERNTGYTVMSNHHLRNKELTLKAKGLLSQMLSLPEDWDYTLAGLSYINRESIDAIRTAVWELEKAGYITRRQGRGEKGKMTAIEYTIYEQPQSPGSHSPGLENPTPGKPILENPISAYENAGGRAQRFLKLTERHAAFTNLTPAILNEFISRIEVHERDQKRARYAIQHISIYFNYIGKFENEVTQLAEPTEQEIRQMRKKIEEAQKEKSRAYHRQYSREYRARNLEKQREYDRMKAREYRARRKAQAAAAQPTQ